MMKLVTLAAATLLAAWSPAPAAQAQVLVDAAYPAYYYASDYVAAPASYSYVGSYSTPVGYAYPYAYSYPLAYYKK